MQFKPTNNTLALIRFAFFLFIICFITISAATKVDASQLKAINLDFKIPTSGTQRPNVPYVMFNVDYGEIGQANIAVIYIKSEDSRYSYYDIAGSYSHYELIDGKYSRSVIPISDVPNNTVFNEIRVAIVPTAEYNSGYFEPQSYMESLPESFFTEGQNKLTIDLTINKTESTQTKTFKRMGWYGQFLLPGMPANSMIAIKQVGDVISGRNAVTDSMGVYEFEDTPIHGIGWLLGLGDIFTTPAVSTHEVWSYIADAGIPSGGVTPYTFSYTKYPVGYDMHYDSTMQTVVFTNELSAGDTIFKTTNDSAFEYTAVNRTAKGGSIKYSVPSGNGVATVNSTTGLVTIVGIGTVRITATAAAVSGYNATSISYDLTVTAHSILHELSFSDSELQSGAKTIEYLQVADFNGEAVSSTAGSTPIVYSSSNENIALVDSNGKVTIKGYGSVIITASIAETQTPSITYLQNSIEYTLIVRTGDVNGDNEVNNTDMLVITQSDNYNKNVEDSSIGESGDLNHDGIINFLDLSMIRNYLAK